LGDDVDDLETGNPSVWVVVTRGTDGADRPYLREQDCESLAPLRVCRAVRDDGTLLIGDADPEHDAMMSELLLVDDCGEA
jgi:hypothetical protein